MGFCCMNFQSRIHYIFEIVDGAERRSSITVFENGAGQQEVYIKPVREGLMKSAYRWLLFKKVYRGSSAKPQFIIYSRKSVFK